MLQTKNARSTVRPGINLPQGISLSLLTLFTLQINHFSLIIAIINHYSRRLHETRRRIIRLEGITNYTCCVLSLSLCLCLSLCDTNESIESTLLVTSAKVSKYLSGLLLAPLARDYLQQDVVREKEGEADRVWLPLSSALIEFSWHSVSNVSAISRFSRGAN